MRGKKISMLVAAMVLSFALVIPAAWSAVKCPQGFGNCDKKSSNKCETNLMTSVANCGACGKVCPSAPNAQPTCVNGICGLVCASGFGNCDGNPLNGCETSLGSSIANCGTCGKVCPAVANATSYCANGVCGFTCNSGFANCDGNSSNGCETNLAVSPANCGACGKVCPAAANATSSCSSGVCGFTCNSGFANCDGNSSNGCETNLASSPTNCGACGKVCPAAANATSSCINGVCGFTCNSGFGNCDGNSSNGCEQFLMSSTANCGACGKVCPAVANATPYCSNGVCGFNCSSGFANCDGNPSNGCETNVRTSPTNCGGCGTVCPARPNATMTCVSGVCGFTCNVGFGNCDGNALNGCEVDLRTSTSNCGACGIKCAVGQTCSAGRCM